MINLTIQSNSDKSIKIVDILENNITTVINNNETVNIPYSNYYLDITTNTDSFNMVNIWSNIDTMTSDIIFIFVALLIIVVALIVPKILEKLG